MLDRLTEKVKHNLSADVKRLIVLHDNRVFTHGDLNNLNITVEGNKSSGIVDWEISGWYSYCGESTTDAMSTFAMSSGMTRLTSF